MKRQNYHLLVIILAGATTLSITAHDRGGKESPFDLNDDGSITKEEFAVAGAAMAQELQEAFLDKYDSVPQGQQSGDGIIVPTESVGVHQARAEEWLADLLKQYDTNKDGAISSADNLRVRGGLGHLRVYDSNKDGTVSGDELVAAATKMAADMQARFIRKYDSVPQGATAGDAIITAEESLAVHQEIVAERIGEILDRYDANNDGSVTKEEIEEVHDKHRRARPGPGPRR